jgi:polar amino acid transport system substrate-binding protein
MANSLASMVLGQKGLRTSPYAFEADMLDDLVAGRLSACAISPATIGYYNYTHPDKPLGMVYAYEQEPGWTVSVGMRTADDALVGAVDAVLSRMLRDGTVTQIYSKYGVEHRLP